MNITDGMRNVAVGVCMGAINTGVAIERGVLAVGEGSSRVMYDIYSLDGFEKWSKALIANLRFLSLLPQLRGVFDEFLKTLESQKDLYYATMSINSLKEFIGETKVAGKTHYHFKFPTREIKVGRNKVEVVDSVKLLLAIGNFFETGKFLQKYKVYAFPLCSQVANRLASVKVFSYGGKTYTLDTVPVLQTLTDKPKDFFIVLSSIIEIWRCKDKPLLDIENMCKLVGSTGKIVLITFGRISNKAIWFSVVDVVTQDVSLIAFIYKKHKDRERNFNRPGFD